MGREEDQPGLIVFDINNANAAVDFDSKLKTKLKRSTSIIGFLAFAGDLKAKATEAELRHVMRAPPSRKPA